MKYFLAILLHLTLGQELYGEEGALPRGKDSGPGVKYKVSTFEDPDGDCHTYMSNPEQGYISFNPFSKKAFFIGLESGTDKKKASSFVLELDLETLTVKKRIQLKVKSTASLVAHREPTEAVTIFNFKKATFACGQGESAGVGVRWSGKQGVIKTFQRERYKIISASSGQEILDRNDYVVRIFDLKTFAKTGDC